MLERDGKIWERFATPAPRPVYLKPHARRDDAAQTHTRRSEARGICHACKGQSHGLPLGKSLCGSWVGKALHRQPHGRTSRLQPIDTGMLKIASRFGCIIDAILAPCALSQTTRRSKSTGSGRRLCRSQGTTKQLASAAEGDRRSCFLFLMRGRACWRVPHPVRFVPWAKAFAATSVTL